MAKTIQTVAYEVLAGKWGSGEERKQKLTKAGYDYNKVQTYVNKILATNKKVLEACEVQANWMKNYTYNWSKWKPRTVARSKKYGTCVTYASCVLQRLGYLKSGEYLWHNGKGYGTGKVYIWGKNGKRTITKNDHMTVIYIGNKTFASLRGQLRAGDFVMVDDNRSGQSGSGGHIMIFSGKWSTKGNPMIWDNTSGTRMKNGKKGRHAYGKNRKILAIVRVEPIIATQKTTKKTNEEIAKEVIKGKWGNGNTRKKKLTKAGYDYNAIQKEVTKLLQKNSNVLIAACKTQAKWMKNYTYKWVEGPTIANTKKYGTCVSYVGVVLQRIGILKSGQYIWINSKGKVEGANSKMTVTYMSGTLKSNKSKLKKGDIIIGGNGNTAAAGGSHIFILTGKWDENGNPYIYDQDSAGRVKAGKVPEHTWKGNFKMIARIRLK